jgi:hypothetical protein
MNKNKLFTATLVSLFFILALLLSLIALKKSSQKKPLSPNILYLTSPVYSFSGTVEKIEGKAIYVSQKITENNLPFAPFPPNPNPSPFPTPKTVTLSYRVLISEKTQISKPPIFINYLFITPTPTAEKKLSINNIKIGQTVTVTTNQDLRTLTSDTFEATTVSLPPIINTLSGKVFEVKKDILIVKAFTPQSPNERDYQIKITKDTEISRIGTNGKPEKLSLEEIKKEMGVIVYTDEDVTQSQKLTALRLEPILPPSPAVSPALPPPITSPSPIASPSPFITP